MPCVGVLTKRYITYLGRTVITCCRPTVTDVLACTTIHGRHQSSRVHVLAWPPTGDEWTLSGVSGFLWGDGMTASACGLSIRISQQRGACVAKVVVVRMGVGDALVERTRQYNSSCLRVAPGRHVSAPGLCIEASWPLARHHCSLG